MGNTVSVTVDTSKLVAAFAKFPGEVRRSLRKAMGEAVEDVAGHARKNHRFNHPPHMTSYRKRYTPSGNLERSIQTEVGAEGFSGRAYLDRGIAEYGPRIHEGFGTWAPDPFLENAGTVRADRVRERIQAGIDAAIRRAGL